MPVPFKKILLPLDGSETAAQAIPYAEELAALSGAQLVLLQVVADKREEVLLTEDFKVKMPTGQQIQAAVDHSTRVLQRFADELILRKIPTEVVVDVGETATKILDYAAHNNVDLIVMCTHGRTAVARWVYGSVASKVLSSAPCPVFLVRSTFR
jgi:nucleotide-binding universal stress UspA family protein